MKQPTQLTERPQTPLYVLQRAATLSEPQLNRINANRLKRIFRELHALTNDPHPSVAVYPAESDPNFWNLYFTGPEETPYEEGVFHAYIRFPDDYPISPPDIRFITPIYHCNINSNGRICHSILTQFYKTDVTIREIFDNIFGLLMTPEPSHPLDANIAAEYMDSLEVFRKKAREHTLTHAKSILREYVGDVQETGAPSHLCDPTTGRLMEEPVICIKTGKTYERSVIEDFVRRTGREPSSCIEVKIEDLVPNEGIKNAIREYHEHSFIANL